MINVKKRTFVLFNGLLTLFLVLFFGLNSANALDNSQQNDDTCTICGYVQDADSYALSDVTVEFVDAESHEYSCFSTTDNNGFYTFDVPCAKKGFLHMYKSSYVDVYTEKFDTPDNKQKIEFPTKYLSTGVESNFIDNKQTGLDYYALIVYLNGKYLNQKAYSDIMIQIIPDNTKLHLGDDGSFTYEYTDSLNLDKDGNPYHYKYYLIPAAKDKYMLHYWKFSNKTVKDKEIDFVSDVDINKENSIYVFSPFFVPTVEYELHTSDVRHLYFHHSMYRNNTDKPYIEGEGSELILDAIRGSKYFVDDNYTLNFYYSTDNITYDLVRIKAFAKDGFEVCGWQYNGEEIHGTGIIEPSSMTIFSPIYRCQTTKFNLHSENDGHNSFKWNKYLDGKLIDSGDDAIIDSRLYVDTNITLDDNNDLVCVFLENLDDVNLVREHKLVVHANPKNDYSLEKWILNSTDFKKGDTYTCKKDINVDISSEYKNDKKIEPSPLPPANPTLDNTTGTNNNTSLPNTFDYLLIFALAFSIVIMLSFKKIKNM